MNRQFAEPKMTTAREVNSDGVERFLVWITVGNTTSVHSYEATSAAHAKRKALAEFLQAEAAMSAI